MSAVARIFQEAGWRVSGSDDGFYPPIRDVILRYGLPCAAPYRAENVPADVDWIVVGKHAKLVPESNPEVAAAFARRDAGAARVLSFPEALSHFLGATRNLVLAGSFGKSSCTALAAWILVHAGKDPSYFIGASAIDLPDNGHRGGGDRFVLEGDEYPAANGDDRSKFLFYRPHDLLLLSGEPDHVNVFPTRASYLAPFKTLVRLLPPDGCLVACERGANLEEIVAEAAAPTVWYGLTRGPKARWWTQEIARGETTRFTLVHEGRPAAALTTRLLGDHNIENTVGVAALLLETGAVTADELTAAVAAFSGVRRRLERLTPAGALPVISDFGSSRAKCRAGIETILRQFPERRLIVCFEPHTFSFRSRAALDWYDTLFEGVRRVYVYQPPSHGAQTHDQLTQAEIVERIAASGVEAVPVGSAGDLQARLQAETAPDRDVVLFETSGDFGGAIPQVAAWASRKESR